MDKAARYNRERWEALIKVQALFTRPALGLDVDNARAMVDPEERLGPVAGKDVLCLAAGGGKQSAAFALLGARVTVVDLAEGQLERDRAAAAHYGVEVATWQGDMRDLSRFRTGVFDIVHQGYSLGFVPDARPVFREVARVLRDGGRYHFACANPFTLGLSEGDWNGEGYSLRGPYVAGAAVTYEDQAWVYDRGRVEEGIQPPVEYRHTLSKLVSSLVEQGFVIEHVDDGYGIHPDSAAEPGTWDHFVAVAPPWLGFWAGRGHAGGRDEG